jgi:hypothetical protein
MLRITGEIVRTQVFGDHGYVPFLRLNSKLKNDIDRWQGIKLRLSAVRNAQPGKDPYLSGCLPPSRSHTAIGLMRGPLIQTAPM